MPKRRLACTRLGLPAARVHDQIDPTGSAWHSLLHGARQRVGRRCALGREIWHYQRPSEGAHIANRGLGFYKNWLYFTTPDAHLVSDAKGWPASAGSSRLAESEARYFFDDGPTRYTDHVIVGCLRGRYGRRGFLEFWIRKLE